jgi:hypothetical protein
LFQSIFYTLGAKVKQIRMRKRNTSLRNQDDTAFDDDLAQCQGGGGLVWARSSLLCNKQTPWPLILKRTIATERMPLVDEI